MVYTSSLHPVVVVNETLTYKYYNHLVIALIGPGSSVSIGTGYGLDGPVIESGPGAQPASCTMGTGSFPGA
jgi:hypothetical protein